MSDARYGLKPNRDVIAKRGGDVALVKWVLVQDGWVARTVTGTLVGVDAHTYVIERHGQRREYARSEWMETLP